MSRRLKGICAKLTARGTLAGHGNAGLASNFIDLAHAKIKPGGVLALVLPAAAVSGVAWEGARDLLESEYEDLTVLTIATHGQTNRSFSADTGMAEALVVASKRSPGKRAVGEKPVLFVNFHHRPRSFAEAFEMARAVRQLGKADAAGTASRREQRTHRDVHLCPPEPSRLRVSARNRPGSRCHRIDPRDASATSRLFPSAFHDPPRGPGAERSGRPGPLRMEQRRLR